ncbi:HNH endonuclease signature motif containing protein [Mycobacterium sp. TY814]|uniref:HNH endonuclease signature motif containing protein n=2 Tax=unclassified Mycobacterium TaxID=2642494 RepID=UPI0027406FD5|nr:HNH endonuclease signature motif containing protein [Mycobacterium sp. TY814]MDP7721863.1 HNH endonuclease signature motif containing protein [Mycobacterium sp. TY814]
MSSSTREEIVEVFDASEEVQDRLCALSFDALTTPELLRALERLERRERRERSVRHTLINQLKTQASEDELGGKLPAALAERLRITKAEANRWIAEAEDLGQRRALTGETLPPLLTATAAAQCAGLIGDTAVKVIRSFMSHLPTTVDAGTREAAEQDLAGKACDFRPDQVSAYARELMALLHPDGDYTEQERARKRGLVLGPQQYDGMSRISGLITPELRALIEALWAKLAAPGAGNPDDDKPVFDPDDDAVRRDTRSQPQRNHDAMITAIRELFASGELGTHNGLPVSIIVTTTLKDLEAGAGRARTAGGTRIPLTTLIRWAATAHHYLAVFDQAKPLALYHTKRLANLAQRMMLLAKEGGCTRPGCDTPGYHCQVHHVSGWTNTYLTDIHDLTLACGPDNRLAEKGWTTRKNAHGHTEWLPPAHHDHGQPRINTFHHPEKLFAPEDDEPG